MLKGGDVMLNQVVLVGRIVRDPNISETSNKDKYSNITIAIPRSYKNMNGEYDSDFIPVRLFHQVAATTTEYCRKGDLVGIKGRVARLSGKDLEIIGEKVTFLSNRKESE